MLALTLRGISQRKLRAALTGLAVFLGVSMVAGTLLLSDTINRSFDQIFANANKGVDVSVGPREAFDDNQSGTALPAIDEALVERVRAVEGVAEAAGSIGDIGISILDEEGERVGPMGPPHIAVSRVPDRFSSLDYTQGRAPTRDGELGLDTKTAKDAGFEVGDRVRISGAGGSKLLRLVGIARFGDQDNTGGASLANLTLPAAQELTDKEGEVDAVFASAEEGVPPAELKRRVAGALPDDVRVLTGSESAEEDASDVQDGFGFLTTALLVFAGIALFVGMFLIFNAFSITVVQRTREFAMLRTLGASAKQVRRAVLAEALFTGLLASALGLVVGGIGFVQLILVLFRAFGFDLPAEGLVIAPDTIVISMLVGVLATLAAAVAPALRATRVTPLEALAETGGAQADSERSRRRGRIGLILSALGLAVTLGGLFGSSDFETALSIAGLGLVFLFIGVAMSSDRLVRPIAGAIAAPIQAFTGITGRLARENTQRNPRRTANTAAALMVGLALVTFVSVFADAIKASFSDAIDKQFAGDLVINAEDNFSPISGNIAKRVAELPEVKDAVALSYAGAQVEGVSGRPSMTGVDFGALDRVMNLEWEEGSDDILRDIGPRDTILEADFAEKNDLGVGDAIRVTTRSGNDARYRVVGTIVDRPGLVTGSFAIPLETYRRDFGIETDGIVLVGLREGTSFASGQRRVQRLLDRDFPVVEARSQEESKESQEESLDQLLGMIYALLFLSIVISVVGVVNTLVLTIHERTRELGLLRAIGTSRRQVRRMVRYESVITSLIGAVIGMTLGILLSVAAVKALEEEGLVLSIPPLGLLVGMLVLAALAGIIAAIAPARRASRLDVIEALQYE